jgi:hypothetical protein
MGGNTFEPITDPLYNAFRSVEKPIANWWDRADPFKATGNMVERWNPMPQIKMPTIPGPTKEQLAAQAAQARLLNEQADQIRATEAAAEASARARRARMAGRNSLLLDEVGIIDGTRPMQPTLGA